MGIPIDVDTTSYESASDCFYDANDDAADDVIQAATSADAGGGMAGCDSSGVEWAAQYDAAAQQALVAGETLVSTLGHLGSLLAATGTNHADADSSSVPPGYGGGPYGPGTTSGGRGDGCTISVGSPPSADGSPGNEPTGWGLIAHVMSWTWPNGDQDTLRSVGDGWITAGDQLDTHSYGLSQALSHIRSVTSPEVPSVVQACTDAQTHMQDLGGAYREIGQACKDYAGYLDDAHHEVVSELESLVEWTIGIEAAGALGALFTLGGSEAAAQAAEAGRISVTAGRVANVLSKLAELVRTVVGVVSKAFTKIAEIVAKLKNLLSKGISKAIEKVGSKLPGGGNIGRKLDEAVVHGKGNIPVEGPPNGIVKKIGPDGKVSNYTVYDENGLAIKRVDLTGRAHGPYPTPHTLEYSHNVNPRTGKVFVNDTGNVRPATPDEIP
ncbi:polymorphic toxin type 24 domain-containing protein [Jatrophihabitans sp. YIM 134969]